MWSLPFQGIFFFLLGSFLGALVLQYCSPAIKRQKEAEKTAEATRMEFMEYRASLTLHFSRSAELLNTMAKDYRQLYDHMLHASGALLANQPQWLYGKNSSADQEVLANSLHAKKEPTLPLANTMPRSPVDYPMGCANQAYAVRNSDACPDEDVSTPSPEIRKNF